MAEVASGEGDLLGQPPTISDAELLQLFDDLPDDNVPMATTGLLSPVGVSRGLSLTSLTSGNDMKFTGFNTGFDGLSLDLDAPDCGMGLGQPASTRVKTEEAATAVHGSVGDASLFPTTVDAAIVTDDVGNPPIGEAVTPLHAPCKAADGITAALNPFDTAATAPAVLPVAPGAAVTVSPGFCVGVINKPVPRKKRARTAKRSPKISKTDTPATLAKPVSGCKRKAGVAELDLDPAVTANMTPQELARYIKKEERKKKNRIAAEKSRRKKKAIEKAEAAELAFLRKHTKEQEATIGALHAENRTLKRQLEFFETLFTRGGGPAMPVPPALAAVGEAALRAASNGAVSPCGDVDSDNSSMDGRAAHSVTSASSASPLHAPGSPQSDSDDAMLADPSMPRRKFRVRRRHPAARRAAVGSSTTTAGGPVGGAPGSVASTATNVQPTGGVRAAAIAGAAFAIVFAFIISANLEGLAGQHMAMSSTSASATISAPLFRPIGLPAHDSGVAAATAGTGSAATGIAVSLASPASKPSGASGRALQALASPTPAAAVAQTETGGHLPATPPRVATAMGSEHSRLGSMLGGLGRGMGGMGMGGMGLGGVLGGLAASQRNGHTAGGGSPRGPSSPTATGHLAEHGHTLADSLAWPHGGGGVTGGADPGASVAAFLKPESPPVPQLWSPSAAVTFMLYALGIKQFAEVVLVNTLLLGVGVGVWTVVQRARGGATKPTPAGRASRKRRRVRTRSMVTAHTPLHAVGGASPVLPTHVACVPRPAKRCRTREEVHA